MNNLEINMKNIIKGLLKRKEQKEKGQGKTNITANVKCKECGMQFQSKDNLQIHKKKTHSGRGEKKKKA